MTKKQTNKTIIGRVSVGAPATMCTRQSEDSLGSVFASSSSKTGSVCSVCTRIATRAMWDLGMQTQIFMCVQQPLPSWPKYLYDFKLVKPNISQ